jgi:hypothetical protein
MSKTFVLKIGLGLLVAAILSVFYGLRTENVAAQTKKKKAAVNSKSLCQAREQTIWTCTTTRNKIASVCASRSLTEDRGYVQYRFGTPGKIELEFPKARQDSPRAFKYSRYTRPRVTMLTLKFANNGVVYEIHDDDNSEEKPAVRAASIDIKNSEGKDISSVVCKLPVRGSLMNLETIVPRDEEN